MPTLSLELLEKKILLSANNTCESVPAGNATAPCMTFPDQFCDFCHCNLATAAFEACLGMALVAGVSEQAHLMTDCPEADLKPLQSMVLSLLDLNANLTLCQIIGELQTNSSNTIAVPPPPGSAITSSLSSVITTLSAPNQPPFNQLFAELLKNIFP